MSIDIPTETLRELVQHPDELQREIVLAMYQSEEFTGGKAREMLGLTVCGGFRWECQCSLLWQFIVHNDQRRPSS